MAWTYSGNPASSARDAVRFHIGDTDTLDQLLQDAEIDYLLSTNGNQVLAAALLGVDMIAMKFARLADEAVGQVRISYNQKYQAYLKMKDALRQRIAIDGCIPYAGGISKSDKESRQDNDDRVGPAFTKHKHEARSLAVNPEPDSDHDHLD